MNPTARGSTSDDSHDTRINTNSRYTVIHIPVANPKKVVIRIAV